MPLAAPAARGTSDPYCVCELAGRPKSLWPLSQNTMDGSPRVFRNMAGPVSGFIAVFSSDHGLWFL